MFTGGKGRKLHQHFQNDVELALRMAQVKSEVVEAFKAWATNAKQFYEILKTVNASTYLSPAPSVKVRHLILGEIFSPTYSYRTWRGWEMVMDNLLKLMYLPYAERQEAFVKIFNLKIGDPVFVTRPENHLHYPFIINTPLLNALDRKETLKIIDITSDFIVVQAKDSTLLKVPYSIVYKNDGSIVYPKKAES